MKEQIDSIKNDAAKLLVLVKALALVHPSNEMDIWSVLLQNLAHKGYSCVNYNQKKEWENMLNIQAALVVFKQYNSYHTIDFIVQEVEMMFDYASFAQEDMERTEYERIEAEFGKEE